MRSKKYYAQNAAIIILALAIIVMSVGYATYSTNLQLKGVTKVQSSKWSVLFENPQTYSTTTIPESQISQFELTDSTSLSFDVTMGINDTYSFAVDVVNKGTFDAKLNDWTLTAKKSSTQESLGISEDKTTASNSYLTYSVKWLDGTSLSKNEPLKHYINGKTDNVKKLLVTVQTHEPANAADLPVSSESYEFNFQMNYGTDF